MRAHPPLTHTLEALNFQSWDKEAKFSTVEKQIYKIFFHIEGEIKSDPYMFQKACR